MLYLNVGSRAEIRNVAEGENDEKLEVRQIGPTARCASPATASRRRHNDVDLIVFDAGAGDDEILFLPGR